MLAKINSLMLISIILVKVLKASTNCLYNQYFTIFDGQTSITPYRASGYQFAITWDTPQPNITSSSYILIGFKSLNNSKLLSFEAAITSPTATGAVFNFNPTTNSQILFAHFSIVLLKNCNAEVFLQYIEYIPSLLNKPRWERQGFSQQTLMINQTFNFSTTQYKSAIMISSMTVIHVEDMIRLLLTLKPIAIANNYQQLVFFSNFVRNNSITKICLTYFMVGEASVKSQHYIYNFAKQTPVNSFSAPAVFFPNATHKCLVGMYDFRNAAFNNDPFSIIVTPSAVTSGPIIYNVALLRVQIYNFYVACLASCQLNYVPEYTSNTQTCLPCLGLISNCIECNSFSTCLACANGYYLNSTFNDTCSPCLSSCKICLNNTFCLNCTNSSNFLVTNLCTQVKGCVIAAVSNLTVVCRQCNLGLHLFLNTKDNVCECIIGFYVMVSAYNMECVRCLDDCYSCKDDQTCIFCLKGSPVDGGCTADSGCLKVNSSLPYEDNRCTVCDQTNFYTLIEGTCVCMQGYFQISNTCTNITGCVVARKVSNLFVCSNCNTRTNFQNLPINNTCICKQGYYVSNGECLDICGDGKRYTNQCDDGNLIDNDGCSKNCAIEPNFACYGSNMEKSKCIYLKYDIGIKLSSINKVFMSNQGIFKFKITPYFSSYQLLDLQKSVYFITSKNHSIVSKSVSVGYLTIEVQYTEDLEGQPATLVFELNRPYFLQNKATLDFSMVSNDSKLIISQNQQQLGSIASIINFISLLSLAIFFGSLYFHKMIGVQTIQSLQVIFLVHMINEDYTTPFGLISSLSNSALNFLFSAEQTTNIYSIRNNFKFDVYNEYLSQVTISVFTFLSVAFLMILLLIKKIKYQRDDEDKSPFSDGLVKINQYIDKAYNNGVFPLNMGFFLISFLIKVTQIKFSECSLVITCGTVCQTILSSQIFFYETKYLILEWQNGSHGIQQAKRYFICYYLVFQLLVSGTIILGYMNFGFPFILEYYLTILYLIFFAFFVIFRPYNQIIHNIGLLLNIFTTLSFLVWCSLRKMKLSDIVMQEGKEIVAVYILISLISLCLLVAILRIVMEIKSSSLCKPPEKKIAKRKTNRIFYPQSDQFSDFQDVNKNQNALLKHHHAYLMEFNLNHKIISKNIIPVTLFEQSIQKRKKSHHEQLIMS